MSCRCGKPQARSACGPLSSGTVRQDRSFLRPRRGKLARRDGRGVGSVAPRGEQARRLNCLEPIPEPGSAWVSDPSETADRRSPWRFRDRQVRRGSPTPPKRPTEPSVRVPSLSGGEAFRGVYGRMFNGRSAVQERKHDGPTFARLPARMATRNCKRDNHYNT